MVEKADTMALNLRIERRNEQLTRDTIAMIRDGGPAFRAALQILIEDVNGLHYLPTSEIDRRFSEVHKRLFRLESKIMGDT